MVVLHEEDYEGTRKPVFEGDNVMDDERGTGVSGRGATKIKGGRGDTGVSTKTEGAKEVGTEGRDSVLFEGGARIETLLRTHHHFFGWTAGMW